MAGPQARGLLPLFPWYVARELGQKTGTSAHMGCQHSPVCPAPVPDLLFAQGAPAHWSGPLGTSGHLAYPLQDLVSRESPLVRYSGQAEQTQLGDSSFQVVQPRLSTSCPEPRVASSGRFFSMLRCLPRLSLPPSLAPCSPHLSVPHLCCFPALLRISAYQTSAYHVCPSCSHADPRRPMQTHVGCMKFST